MSHAEHSAHPHETLLHIFDLRHGLEFDSNKQASLDLGERPLTDFHTFRNCKAKFRMSNSIIDAHKCLYFLESGRSVNLSLYVFCWKVSSRQLKVGIGVPIHYANANNIFTGEILTRFNYWIYFMDQSFLWEGKNNGVRRSRVELNLSASFNRAPLRSFIDIAKCDFGNKFFSLSCEDVRSRATDI